MDTASFATITISIILLAAFIKFIVSPLIRVVLGIIIFLLVVYAFQKFFQFDLSRIFGPLAQYMDIGKWPFIQWILWPVDYILNKMKIIFNT